MEKIEINGKNFKAHKIDLYGAALLIIEGGKGFLACGYINLQTAERLGQATAIVTGVKNTQDMLKAKVIAVSTAAATLGVKPDMAGEDALALLA